ncbi:unnamed protein product, partial [Heterotrigona itama]
NLQVCYQAACATYADAGSEQPLHWMIRRSVKCAARMNSGDDEGESERRSDQRTPKKRARNIGWSRWHACQPADEVHAGWLQPRRRVHMYTMDRGDVARGCSHDTVFPPSATNRIFCNVSLSNERDEGVTRSRHTEAGGKRNGQFQERKRHGASRNSTGGSEPSSNRVAGDVRSWYSAGYVGQKKHKIITRTTRQATIEHEDARRCAFNTPLTRLRPGASAAKLFRHTNERN